MRALDILLEHNIINLPDVEAWVNQLAERVTFPEGKAWIAQKARRFIVNCDETSAQVTQLGPSAPDWMRTALDRGDALYRFRSNPDVWNKLSHIADWLNSLHTTATTPPDNEAFKRLSADAVKFLPKLSKLTIETAEPHVANWFARLNVAARVVNAKESGADGEKKLIVRTDRGDWFQLLDKAALQWEGGMMGHCVGGYEVNERTQIYSFRDQKNEPHITMEVSDNEVIQVKGKQNKPPVARYQSIVLDLLNHLQVGLDYGGENDLRTMGIEYRDGQYGTIKDFGKILAEIDDVDFISMGGDSTVYIWKGAVYGTLIISDNVLKAMTNNGHNDAAQAAVVAVAVKFLNSLSPVPTATGGSVLGNSGIVFNQKSQKWGAPYEVSEPFAEIDGYDVRVYTTREGANDVEHYIWMKGDTLALTINATIYHDRAEKQKRASAINRAGPPPRPEDLVAFLKQIDAKPDEGRMAHFGVWQTKDGEPVVFSPDHPELGQATQLTDEIWAVPISAKSIYFIGADGLPFAFLHKDSGSIDRWEHINPEITRKIREIEKAPVRLCDVLNARPYTIGTLSKWSRESYRKLGVVYTKGTFKALSDGKELAAIGDLRLTESGTKLTVVDGNGSVVLTAAKETGKVVTLRNLSSDRRSDNIQPSPIVGKAFLVLQKWMDENEYKYAGWPPEDFLALCGYMLRSDPKQGNEVRVVATTSVWPDEELKAYPEENEIWIRRAFSRIDKSVLKYSTPSPNRYALMKETEPGKREYMARVICNSDDKISTIAVNSLNGKMELSTEHNVKPFVDKLADLVRLKSLTCDTTFLLGIGLTIQGGALKSISDNPRLAQFANGEINYEDGHEWKKTGKEWLLTIHVENQVKRVMRVEIGTYGLEKIDIIDQTARKRPKTYLPYLNDLIELAHEAMDDD